MVVLGMAVLGMGLLALAGSRSGPPSGAAFGLTGVGH
jgi:hypothetical protein